MKRRHQRCAQAAGGNIAAAKVCHPIESGQLGQQEWAGREVRTLTDWVIITVCDTRLVTMRYGQAILAGLPAFPLVRDEVSG